MSFPYHGNYVGPGWSAGKYQNSVVSTVEPIDEFDKAGQTHDAAYSRYQDNSNRARADWQFVSDTKNLGTKAQFARTAVAIQALGRDTYSYIMGQGRKIQRKKGGKTVGSKRKTPGPNRKQQRANVKSRSQKGKITPSMLTNTNTTWKTRFSSSVNGARARATGCEFIGVVQVTSSDIIGKALFFQNVAPQFLAGTRLQVMANQFEKYKYRTGRLLLRSKCSNTTNGSVVAYFERDVSEVTPNVGIEGIKKAVATYGSEDIPVKTDGVAYFQRISDENPYFTDFGASQTDPAFGQATAIVQLNATGSSVISSGTIVVYDILFEYDIDFWIPQLQTEQVLFYTFVQPTGAGATTSALLGTVATIEEGGNLDGVTFDGASVITVKAQYSHYYQVIYTVDGATVAGCSITASTDMTQDEASSANASGTSNVIHKTYHLTSTSGGFTKNVTFTLAATTITTPTFVGFQIIDFGAFAPHNPIATTSMASAFMRRFSPKSVQSRKVNDLANRITQSDNAHAKRIEKLEQALEDFRSTKSGSNIITSVPEDKPLKVEVLDECFYCHEVDPDHLGRNCPKNPRNMK